MCLVHLCNQCYNSIASCRRFSAYAFFFMFHWCTPKREFFGKISGFHSQKKGFYPCRINLSKEGLWGQVGSLLNSSKKIAWIRGLSEATVCWREWFSLIVLSFVPYPFISIINQMDFCPAWHCIGIFCLFVFFCVVFGHTSRVGGRRSKSEINNPS